MTLGQRTPLPLRLHLTNVTALGPAQVAISLLPALEACPAVAVREVYLPAWGPLAGYRRSTPGPEPRHYPRILPSAVSRTLECTVLARRFDGPDPILVMGDIPLACDAPQAVFVQTAHFFGQAASPYSGSSFNHRTAQRLFRWNAHHASLFIAQTELMKRLVAETDPAAGERTVVIAQPPPAWLVGSGLRRVRRVSSPGDGLRLLYPAAEYLHKNHALLGGIGTGEVDPWPVAELILTLPPERHPNPAVDWIRCAGVLSPAAMLRAYKTADAVVYLSQAESYGLPLVEAMHVGLPVVAPDLPYARSLCGDEAIYFDPASIGSLRAAVQELRRRLDGGWWPDWTERMAVLPRNWGTVAEKIVRAVRDSV